MTNEYMPTDEEQEFLEREHTAHVTGFSSSHQSAIDEYGCGAVWGVIRYGFFLDTEA